MLRDFLAGNTDIDPARARRAPPDCPNDPELVAQLIGQLQNALQSTGDGINWDLALEQAKGIATRTTVAVAARRALRARAGAARGIAVARRGHVDRRAHQRARAA